MTDCVNCGRKLKYTEKYCSRKCYTPHSRVSNQTGEKNVGWINIISESELRELYIKQLQSISYISNLKNCSENVIRRRLKKWKIRIRPYAEQFKITLQLKRIRWKLRDSTSNKGNRKNYLEIAKEHLRWECSLCGKKNTNDSFDLVVHLRSFVLPCGRKIP